MKKFWTPTKIVIIVIFSTLALCVPFMINELYMINKPYYFVMRDGSVASDSVATNFEQIFATYSPDTVRKVL